MIKIPGLTLRGLIKGTRTDGQTVGRSIVASLEAVSILFSNYSLEQHSKTTRQTKYMIVRTSFFIIIISRRSELYYVASSYPEIPSDRRRPTYLTVTFRSNHNNDDNILEEALIDPATPSSSCHSCHRILLSFLLYHNTICIPVLLGTFCLHPSITTRGKTHPPLHQ
jgi:hypothetical protein